MNLFSVYPRFDVELDYANGAYVYDPDGIAYLDFYGGHAVISVGHNHPYFLDQLNKQMHRIIYYSNSVINKKQQLLAEKLCEMSQLNEHELFLCNSGAEATENALKLASFYNKRKKIVAFKNSFHGRTSAAVNVTDNPNIKAPINCGIDVEFFDMANTDEILSALDRKDVCAVILEVVQGIGGLDVCPDHTIQEIRSRCDDTNTILIADEVQCGFGRTGKFFAFQHAGIHPDIVCMAKGMGNGFPVGGILINPNKFSAKPGMLGSTFGGNYLACTAALSVLNIIQAEGLVDQAEKMGELLKEYLASLPYVLEVKGLGLMLGCRFEFPIQSLRKQLVYKEKLFTGSAADPHLLRLLPPLCITEIEIEKFADKMNSALKSLPADIQKVNTLTT